MGGHIVAGHVDATGHVQSLERRAEFALLSIELPDTIAPLVAKKGSIAIDGVSLTVNEVGVNFFQCTAIPHTIAHTTLDQLGPGSIVNLEADVVARYLARLLSFQGQAPDERLKKALEAFFS
jgi:riboflavin synthase